MRKFINVFIVSLSIVGFIVGIVSISSSYYKYISTHKNSSEIRQSSLAKDILFISSYSPSYPYTQVQINAFNHVFDKKGLSYDSAFMDMKIYNTQENINNFYTILKYKLANHTPYKAVIASDDHALEFVLDYYDEFFSSTPVVYMGINNEDLAIKANMYPNITGSTEVLNFKDIFNTIEDLFPKTEHIALIYDTATLATLGFYKQFLKFNQSNPFNIISMHTSSTPRKELITKLQNLPENSVVLIIGMYNDKEGHPYSIYESRDLLVANAKAPIFTIILDTLGTGILCGSIFNVNDAAQYTAQTVEKILNGGKISDFPLRTDFPSTLKFDYNVMKKYEIETEDLPENTVFLNEPKKFIKEFSFITYPALLILSSMFILLWLLILYSLHIKTIKEKLEFQLSHDLLTMLPNHNLATIFITNLIKQKEMFSVMMLDIEGFRIINDYYSHIFGDRILTELADRLITLNEIGDYSAYRLHGDEFLLIRKGKHIKEKGLEFYYLKQLLSEPFYIQDTPIFTQISIGIINSSKLNQHAEDYIINSEIALYEAKRRGAKNASFTEEMRHDIERKHNIARDVEFACQNDGFIVMFQPQVLTEDGTISGFEALSRLRMMDENGIARIIAPADFIPVAEKSGYISKIGRIITEKTIRTMAEWKKKGIKLHKMSINFSAAQITDYEYVTYLEELLRKYEISPSLICIEITESLFLENKKQATELFNQFSKLGVQLALDDFGTGYSSLSYLAFLPVNIVKIDKTMVDNYLSLPEKDAFMRNIVNLVHSLNMKLIVEGIETRQQYDKIKSFGGDYIQGYFFSKPIPAEEVESFEPIII